MTAVEMPKENKLPATNATVRPQPDTERKTSQPQRGSTRTQKRARTATVTAVLSVIAVTALLAGILVGSSGLTVMDLLRVFSGTGETSHQFIVFELRLPRALGALLVGASFGMAGALTQSFSRNPLATPDIIGVTSGAAMGAVATIALGGGSYAVGTILMGIGLPAVAVISGLLTAALVYGLSWRSGVNSFRLILVGIGVTAAMTGMTNYLIAKADLGVAAAATQWLVGSLSGASWTGITPVVVVLVIMTPIALSQTRELDVTQLGDELSAGLGVSLNKHRVLVLTSAVILTAVAVSASGPIGFVAFVAPQIARTLINSSRPGLITSALVGAIVVSGADILGRTAFPWPVPVGIITAFIGAPYLIWLIVRRPSKNGKS